MDGGQGSSIALTIHSLGLTLRMSHFTFRSVPRADDIPVDSDLRVCYTAILAK